MQSAPPATGRMTRTGAYHHQEPSCPADGGKPTPWIYALGVAAINKRDTRSRTWTCMHRRMASYNPGDGSTWGDDHHPETTIASGRCNAWIWAVPTDRPHWPADRV